MDINGNLQELLAEMNSAVAGLKGVSDHSEQRLAHIRRLAWGMYVMATPPPTSPAGGTSSSAAATAKV